MNISFFDEPTSVVDYVRLKKPQIHFDYDEIRFEAHQRAFTVAKITRLDLLADIQESLANAYKNGWKFDKWKQEIEPILAKKGWIGDNVKVVNPKTGEEKEIKVGNRRLKNIFNTNMRTAYSYANYQSGIKSGAKYLRYTAVLDKDTRASHRAMHSKIYPIKHPFWKENYPPNGWNCRCSVMFLDDDDLESYGWKVSEQTPLNIAEPDWAYHVGENKSDIMAIYNDKIQKLSERGASDEFVEFAKKDFLSTLKERVENLGIFSAIKNFFKEPLKNNNKLSGRIKLTNTPSSIKTAFNNKNLDEIYLSHQTILTHKKHTNITAWDYFVLKRLLNKNIKKIKQSGKEKHVVAICRYLGKGYKIVLKQTNINEIYIQSVTKGKNIK